jgi:hypothetical protein
VSNHPLLTDRDVFRYTVYGICLQTPFPCPELKPTQGNPDVYVSYGQVPEALESPDASAELFQVSATQFLLKFEPIACYLAQNGDKIIIQLGDQVNDVMVRGLLLGAVLSVLMHQRGMLALHASAILSSQGAVLFLGSSGAGKSTLLTAFLERGYRMLSDDVIGLSLDKSGRPLAYPGYPQVKLWDDALTMLGRSTKGLHRLLPQAEKYVLPADQSFVSDPAPLYALYALETHDKPTLSLIPLEDIEKLSVFINNTYRPLLLSVPALRQHHFHVATVAANRIKVRRLVRPQQSFSIREMIKLIEEDLSSERND